MKVYVKTMVSLYNSKLLINKHSPKSEGVFYGICILLIEFSITIKHYHLYFSFNTLLDDNTIERRSGSELGIASQTTKNPCY